MIRRESSTVVSSRVDSRDLALLAKSWHRETNVLPSTMSTLVRECLGTLADMFAAKYPELVVHDHEEAQSFLERAGLSQRSSQASRETFRAVQRQQQSYNNEPRFTTPPTLEPEKPLSAYDEQLAMVEATCEAMKKMGESEENVAKRRQQALEKLAAKYNS